MNANDRKVIPLCPRRDAVSAIDKLTARLIMQRHAAGTLDPAVVAALLLAVGLQP